MLIYLSNDIIYFVKKILLYLKYHIKIIIKILLNFKTLIYIFKDK